MARTCTKNASNYISLTANSVGAALHGASAITVHGWCKYTSFDAGDNQNGDRILQIQISGTTSTGIAITQDGSGGGTNQKLRIAARSQSGDALQGRSGTTNLVTGTWYGMGGVIDIAGDTITPYLNGTAENGGAVTFGAATYTNATPTGTDYLGGDRGTGTAQQVDGQVAEIAIWNVALTAGEMLALGRGYSPLLVRPQSLIRYWPLLGRTSPELEMVRGASATINGTVAQADHPRIIYPASRRSRWLSVVTGGGPTDWTKSITESITTSDTWSKVWVINRTITDSIDSTDAFARAWGFNRSISDSISPSDTWTNAWKFNRSISDTITVSDSIVGALPGTLTASLTFELAIAFAGTSEYLTDPEGFNYQFTSDTSNAFEADDPDYSAVSVSVATYASSSVQTTTYTSSTVGSTTWS